MSTSRITISLPKHVGKQLNKYVPSGQVSSFVSRAIEEKIDRIAYRVKESPLDRMFRLADALPKFSREEIQKAIDEGRP